MFFRRRMGPIRRSALRLPPTEPLATSLRSRRGIWKRFASTQALQAVNLRLEYGQCLGLVGRNGAGKSTLVSVLSGLVVPDKGRVLFDGEQAPSHADAGGWHRRIATVYQHSMVVPSLTVAENVFLGGIPPDGTAESTGRRCTRRRGGLCASGDSRLTSTSSAPGSQ